MGKKATKAAGNVYYDARYEVSQNEESFKSREKASELLNVDRTRLARIELGTVMPHPEEVLLMSRAYNMPELCNSYCANECPIGKTSVSEVVIDDFDRLALKVLGSLKNVDELTKSLIVISEDGVITHQEVRKFEEILAALDKISNNANALKIWALKNLEKQQGKE